MEHEGGGLLHHYLGHKTSNKFYQALDRSWLMISFTTINQKQTGTHKEERRERMCKWGGGGASMGRLSTYDCFGFWGQLEY